MDGVQGLLDRGFIMDEHAADQTHHDSRYGTVPGYMPGFGGDFETEALPGALPQGRN
jgi:homogentisate 1,2-dioxygenase